MTLTIANGTITDVEPAAPGDTFGEVEKSTFVAPGFFDLQVNGFRGIDYSGAELGPRDVETLVRALAASGTTRHVPTIITNSQDRILTNIKTVVRAIDNSDMVAAAIPGIHIEGPFIAPEDGPRGAHDPRYVHPPSIDEYHEWQNAAGGRVTMVTLAPERPGALELIVALTQDGVVPAIGHTAASPEQIRAAVDAGARFATHLGNGSHAMLPRLKNYVWAQLAANELTAGIIADGFHLPQEVLTVFVRAKGTKRLVLTSDVGPIGGLPPGRHRWGNVDVEVHPDGHVGMAGTEFLAGAGHLLDRCLGHIVDATGISHTTAVELCTAAPARLLGLPEPVIAPGQRADIVVFDWPDSGTLSVGQTYIAGQLVYEAGRE